MLEKCYKNKYMYTHILLILYLLTALAALLTKQRNTLLELKIVCREIYFHMLKEIYAPKMAHEIRFWKYTIKLNIISFLTKKGVFDVY